MNESIVASLHPSNNIFSIAEFGRDLVIGCYKYTNIPNSTWGVAIGKKRAETTILRHSMPK